MRSLRISPLMRRASPVGYGSQGHVSNAVPKGLAGRDSTSSVEDENRGGNVVGLPTREELAGLPVQKSRSQMEQGASVEAESTPTRNTTKARERKNISPDTSISDTDRVRAQLQQMWDDGELSPRAPLDRSLGYFSSVSPGSSGKRAANAAAADSATPGATQAYRQHGPQPGTAAPLFISDVRALRQMAPFSSSEEQVLTRSQRRRSSANLLQELVAAQSQGPPQEFHEAQLQQPQHPNAKQQNELYTLTRDQQRQRDGTANQGGRQRQDQQVEEPMPPSACEFNFLLLADSASRGLAPRKRRASSPVSSCYSFSLLGAEGATQGGDTFNAGGPCRMKGRRRLSPPAAGTQEAATAVADLGPTRPSGRSSAGALASTSSNSDTNAVLDTSLHCSSSSNIESPFQKLPPPSPSDFPVSSPISASSCSPRRSILPARQQQQQQGPAAAIRRPSDYATDEKQRQRLGSPLRTSPRRSHIGASAPTPPFQTPKDPCCSPEPQERAAHSSMRQRASRRCLSPLPFVPAGPRARRPTDQKRHEGSRDKDARTLVVLPAPEASAAATPVVQGTTFSAKASVASRRASPLAASKDKGAPDSSYPTTNSAPSTSEAKPAGKELKEAPGICRLRSSPIRAGSPRPPWQGPGRPGAVCTSAAAADQQCRRRMLSAASPKPTSKRGAEGSAASTGRALSATNREAEASAAAPATSAMEGRRRSMPRRTSAVTTTAGLSASLPSGSSSLSRSVCSSHIASQDATSPIAASTASPRRRTTACNAGASTKDASPSKSVPPHAVALRPAARTGGAGDTEGTNGEDKTAARAAAGEKAQAPLTASRRSLPQPATARLSAGKPRNSSSSGGPLQGRTGNPAGRCRMRVLPITKPRPLVSAGDKQRGSAATTAQVNATACGEPVRGLRSSRCRTAAARSSKTSSVAAAITVVRQRRRLAQCHSTGRTKPEIQPAKAMAVTHIPSQAAFARAEAVDGSRPRAAEYDNDTPVDFSNFHNPPETQSMSADRKLLVDSTCDTPNGNIEEGDNTRGRSGNDGSFMVTSALPSSTRSVTKSDDSSSSPVCTDGAAAAPPQCHNSSSLPPIRRRSSSPHHFSLQTGTSDAGGEKQQRVGTPVSVRRASSVCNLGDCFEHRVSAQQQKHEALQQEWEGRDREYQEKQQNLLLEQQRKERLLAWEQREAELLKNRKALSKEEPAFWGFDPFMVDEEDEKVLTTEELRVEVSRFLKGDLRFHSRADLLRVVKKFSEQTRTTTTTTSSRLNFTKVEQRVVPMAARQVHGTVPHERRRKSILRNSNGAQPSECRKRSRGISFSPFNKIQLYMLDEHERASKEAAANLSQQGEQRQQLRQKLAQQFQLMLLRGDSDIELALVRRELADLYDPDEEENLAFLSPTLAPKTDAEAENKGASPSMSQQEEVVGSKQNTRGATASLVPGGSGTGGRLPFTVSPSWRQRPHGVWQDIPGASQTEPCAEWSPPPSPIENSRLNSSEGKQDSDCWGTPVAITGSPPKGERKHVGDENANCNTTHYTGPTHAVMAEPRQALKEVSAEEPHKIFGAEAARRPSVLSRRLSVVPNVQCS